MFSSVLLSILVEKSVDFLPLTTLSLDVASVNRVVNGSSTLGISIRGAESPHSSFSSRNLVSEDPFADYLTLNYFVSATSFDPQFSAVYCLDLLSNITQSSVESKTLDEILSVELNKTVVVLSFLSFRNRISVVYDSPAPTSSPSSLTPGDVVKSDPGTAFANSTNAIYIYIAAGLILFILFFVCLLSCRSRMLSNLEKKYNSSRNVTVYDDDDDYDDGDNPRFHDDIEDRFEDADDSIIGETSFFDEPRRLPRHEIDYNSSDEERDPLSEMNSTRRISIELDERVIPNYERLVMPALRQKLSARRASMESEDQVSSTGHPSHFSNSFGDDDPICRLEDIEINPHLSTTIDPNTEDHPEGTHIIEEHDMNSDDHDDDDDSKSDAETGVVSVFSPNGPVAI